MSQGPDRHARMDQLIASAEALGLRVAFRDLGRRHGEAYSSGIVFINHRRTLCRQRVTLAHEMGHAHYGHDWSREHDKSHDERLADQYAARLLISPVEYALAERLVGEHPGALARELGVTRRLVELRRGDFERDARIFQVVDELRAA